MDGNCYGYEYYYCLCSRPLHSVKAATTNAVPDKVRLVMDDHSVNPISVRYIPPLKYIWYKYLKRKFYKGKRINWEKEI